MAVLAVACSGAGDDAQTSRDVGAVPMADSAAGTGGADQTAEMDTVLTALAGLDPKPVTTLTAPQARQQPTPADAVTAVLVEQGRDTAPTALVPGVTSRDRTIPGAAGEIPARVYTPAGAGPFPVIVYYHGGGWVIGDKQVYDGGARGLSKAANAVVVSVDYRLAPEHPFPAQHDDALAAYRWALKNAASLKGDPERLGLAGESAGGNLAVATAVAARDAGLQIPLHVLSVYPIAQADTTTESYIEHADAKPLNRSMMVWFADQTTTSPAQLQDPRISLVKADLRRLPPVTIIAAEIDPLLTDGRMLASALEQAGVAVERRQYDGVTHEFFGMAAVVPEAQEAQQYAGERFRSAFGS